MVGHPQHFSGMYFLTVRLFFYHTTPNLVLITSQLFFYFSCCLPTVFPTVAASNLFFYSAYVWNEGPWILHLSYSFFENNLRWPRPCFHEPRLSEHPPHSMVSHQLTVSLSPWREVDTPLPYMVSPVCLPDPIFFPLCFCVTFFRINSVEGWREWALALGCPHSNPHVTIY